jgi:hypothetical protein
LYGPLIVVEPGTSFGPTDRILFVADGGPGPRPRLFISGSASPDTMELVAGARYRLRFMYLTSNHSVTTTLRGPNAPRQLRKLAQDGYEEARPIFGASRFNAGAGQIFDFELAPIVPGMLWLDAEYATSSGLTNVPRTTLPIIVRAP